MSKPQKGDQFSLGFRLQNRAVSTLLLFIGPAQGSSESDPRQRLKREYNRRKALHEQRKSES
ncbi:MULTISPECIES: hypothetical protein [Micrococcaceae]|uniref:hypothetical protein n=1 Tax=unclassified Kocuria TaxID=2649579 RepID=UPI0010103883|nr:MULTISPECIES: hypothetical protein [unclassified Kocuria]